MCGSIHQLGSIQTLPHHLPGTIQTLGAHLRALPHHLPGTIQTRGAHLRAGSRKLLSSETRKLLSSERNLLALERIGSEGK